MELAVYSIKGEDTGRKVTLDDTVFGIEPSDHAIYLDVKQYGANQRQGTHATKNKAMVTASTRKIKRQKGTGTARAGSLKSPIFRGGGTVFGPEPRDYSFKLNKKLKQQARRSALTYKAKAGEIVVVEDFSFEEPRTRNFVEILNGFDAYALKTLLVLPQTNHNVVLASRNLQKTKVRLADSLNTYEILNANKMIVSESALETITALLKKD